MFSEVFTVPGHGGQDGEQLSGAGDDGAFDGFSGGGPSFSEGFEGLIALAGAFRGDMVGAAGQLAMVRPARFAQAGQKDGGHHRANSLDGPQAIVGRGEAFTGSDQSRNLGLYPRQMRRQHLDKALDFAKNSQRSRHTQPVVLAPDGRHDILAPGLKFGQMRPVRVSRQGRLQVQRQGFCPSFAENRPPGGFPAAHDPIRARTCASTVSVFASLPIEPANSRA